VIYLLDTDVIVFMIRGRRPNASAAVRERANSVRARCRAAEAEGHRIAVSAITAAELEFGARSAPDYPSEMISVRKTLSPFRLYAFGIIVAPKHYGIVRHALEKQGEPIGAMDLLIAAHALSLGAELVTNNQKHFGRVPGLKLADWTSS